MAGDRFAVYARSGQAAADRDAVEWAREAESRGAGEILLTSIDRDGTKSGFDCAMTSAVSQRGVDSGDRVRRRRHARPFRRGVHRRRAPMRRSPRRSFTTRKPASAH